jgi:hypothetical protein
MKTVFRIFGIIIVLISLLTCSMSIYRAQMDKDDLAESQTQIAEAKTQMAALKDQVKSMTGESKTELDAEIEKIEKMLDSMPSATTYTIVQIVLSALLILSLVFAVFLFKTNLKLSNQLFFAAVILTIIAFFASPDLERGQYSGMPSRTLALLSGIPVVLAGLFSILVARKSTIK